MLMPSDAYSTTVPFMIETLTGPSPGSRDSRKLENKSMNTCPKCGMPMDMNPFSSSANDDNWIHAESGKVECESDDNHLLINNEQREGGTEGDQ